MVEFDINPMCYQLLGGQHQSPMWFSCFLALQCRYIQASTRMHFVQSGLRGTTLVPVAL